MQFRISVLFASFLAGLTAAQNSEVDEIIPISSSLASSLSDGDNLLGSTASLLATTRTITSGASIGSISSEPTPTGSYIVTSIYTVDAIDFFDDADTSVAMPLPTYTGSIVTVNPSGTVIRLDCPYTGEILATEVCGYLGLVTYTMRPTGTEYLDMHYTTTIPGSATISQDYRATCVPAGEGQQSCDVVTSFSISEDGTQTSGTTTASTTRNVTPIPLYLTAGLEKTGPIPEATGTGEDTGAAGALKPGVWAAMGFAAVVGAVPL